MTRHAADEHLLPWLIMLVPGFGARALAMFTAMATVTTALATVTALATSALLDISSTGHG